MEDGSSRIPEPFRYSRHLRSRARTRGSPPSATPSSQRMRRRRPRSGASGSPARQERSTRVRGSLSRGISATSRKLSQPRMADASSSPGARPVRTVRSSAWSASQRMARSSMGDRSMWWSSTPPQLGPVTKPSSASRRRRQRFWLPTPMRRSPVPPRCVLSLFQIDSDVHIYSVAVIGRERARVVSGLQSRRHLVQTSRPHQHRFAPIATAPRSAPKGMRVTAATAVLRLVPLENQQPALVYLGTLDWRTSTITMEKALETAARTLSNGVVGALELPWHELRDVHTARLQEIHRLAARGGRLTNPRTFSIRRPQAVASRLRLPAAHDSARSPRVR